MSMKTGNQQNQKLFLDMSTIINKLLARLTKKERHQLLISGMKEGLSLLVPWTLKG